ncbi:hybrid signal transduction histidine kinase dhkK [Acrasis kona]|uniref:Hybrid signal transduction histidine kinase dhkK n=1 Tax=Acrasis kona TaxID=1008807 RepID=A0AAW2Z864_9EUKA
MNELEDALKCTGTAADQLKDIIDNVLTASMLENNSVKLLLIPFDPFSLLLDICNLFLDKTKEKNVKLTNHISSMDHSRSSMLLLGDPYRIKEVLINLLSNAFKFSKQDGNIFVNCELNPIQDSKFVVKFTVKDDGCGMSERDVNRIMNIGQSSTINTFQLGLKISKELCELMGGNITVESKVNHGSVFYVTLTLSSPGGSSTVSTVSDQESSSDSFSSGTSGSNPDHNGADLGQIKVLVVDDNHINQKILCRLLQKNGYYCEVASDGLEAVQLIAGSQFDVVLMDIEMPVLNGIEATKRVRQMESERCSKKMLPIIGVSGNARDEVADVVKECMMNGYISKPYMSGEVVSTIESVMKKNKIK